MPYVDPEQRRAYHREASKRWREAHPDRVREVRQRWRAKNRPLDRAQSARSRARRAESVHVIYTHRLAPGELTRLYETQKGRCAICERPAPMRGPGCLHIDHDHITGIRRGLLCKPCNTALLAVERDGATWALRALAYLGDPPLQRLRANLTTTSDGQALVDKEKE